MNGAADDAWKSHLLALAVIFSVMLTDAYYKYWDRTLTKAESQAAFNVANTCERGWLMDYTGGDVEGIIAWFPDAAREACKGRRAWK